MQNKQHGDINLHLQVPICPHATDPHWTDFCPSYTVSEAEVEIAITFPGPRLLNLHFPDREEITWPKRGARPANLFQVVFRVCYICKNNLDLGQGHKHKWNAKSSCKKGTTGVVEEAQDTCLGLSLEGLSALMASAVFLISSTVAVCVDISLVFAHTHEPSGLNSHCCKYMLEMWPWNAGKVQKAKHTQFNYSILSLGAVLLFDLANWCGTKRLLKFQKLSPWIRCQRG